MKKLKTIYKEFFNAATSKKEFIEVMSREFPKLKLATITRRYYDFTYPQSVNVASTSYDFTRDEVSEPVLLKKILIRDAKRFHFKITKKFLIENGFNQLEINWLLKHNQVEKDTNDKI